MPHSNNDRSPVNLDSRTVDSFGDEWKRFDQSAIEGAEAESIFEEYFAVFPWDQLPADASGFDMGCGSGRWARLAAPRVGHLHCIDPSAALEVARRSLATAENVSFHQASVDDGALPEASQDFGYSLGVLHHVPDTGAAIGSCVRMLKPGAPFLLYLYYRFDNRPRPYRMLWAVSDGIRKGVSRLPSAAKHVVTDMLALAAYFPLARGALLAEKMGIDVSGWPLAYYRDHSWYTMRTDSRDRFGTPLEQRFTRQEIDGMMRAAGLRNIVFSENAPFWCAVGFREK